MVKGHQRSSCYKQGGKHGQYNTNCKRCCKSLYCSGTAEIQNSRCNQGSDISVYDCRKRLVKSCLNRRMNGFSHTQLFLNTGKDNDVRIHCHTYGKDNSRNTRKGQSHLKGRQKNHDQTYIQSQGNRSCHAGNQICGNHKYNHNPKAHSACL